jgi:hypothetical protein
MYFPWNWEFGLTLSKLRNNFVGVWTPQTPPLGTPVHIQCCSPVMPRICLSECDLSRPWQSDGMVCMNQHRPFRDGMLATCQLSASCCYHVEFQEVCYQKHTNLSCRWPVWNKATFVMDNKKLIILVQGHDCLYNLRHNDYDENVVKDNSWKEIAG